MSLTRNERWALHALVGVGMLAVLFAATIHRYLLFHSLAELFSIVVAASVFMIAWNARRFLDSSYFLFIGVAYAFVAAIHLVHMLVYKGMGVLPSDGPNLSTQMWVAARFTAAASFFLAPLLLNRKLYLPGVVGAYSAAVMVLLLSTYYHLLPDCYANNGLTPFKKIFECIIAAIFAAAAVLLYLRRAHFNPSVLHLLIGSMVLSIIAELTFTAYTDVYGLTNLFGHYFVIVSFYLVYRALIETGLRRPYELLFWNLKRSEESLRESEQRYRALVERSPTAIAVHSDGRFVYLNPAAVNLFGATSSEQLLGRHLLDFADPDDREKVLERMRENQELGRTTPVRETRILRLDGTTVDIEASGSPVVHEGRPAVQVALADISARIEIERQREAHRQSLNTLIRISAQILAEQSVDGLLKKLAAGARELTQAQFAVAGYGSAGVASMGESPRGPAREWAATDMFSATRSGLYRHLIELPGTLRLSDEELRSNPEWSRLPPGHLPLHGLIGVSLWGGEVRPSGLILASDKHGQEFTAEDEALLAQLGTLASLALQHIAAKSRAEEAREVAEGANRVKDDFLAVLSHELRTPLNAISMWTQFLQMDGASPEELAQGLQHIDRSVRIQTQLIEDLLDVSRIVSGKLRLELSPLRLQAVVEAAIETVLPASQAKGIRISRKLDPSVPAMRGDPARLQQVVWNLLSNAVKFTPAGGRVDVELAARDGQAEVIVRDSGQGISAEFLPYVFERFRQADGSLTRRHGGLGLGLAIVRQLVEMHGGSVRAESAGPGQGATFSVLLPLPELRALEAGRPAQPQQARTAPAASRLEALRVLVLDDEPSAREVVARVLRQAGAEVNATGSVAEALDQLAAFKPQVVLSDIAMPDQDGYAFIRELRSRPGYADLPVAALTALARDEDRARMLQAGFTDHLPKPMTPKELIAAVFRLAAIEK